jgi:hypothetical protein
MTGRHDTAYDADQVSCTCGWRTKREALTSGAVRRLAYAHLVFPDASAEELSAVLAEKGERP